MKIVLPTSPVFVPSAKTLNFTTNGLVGSTFDIKRLFAVINQTKNVLIFAETVTGTGYSAWDNASKVLTLQFDTSTHSSSDSLQVIYDDPNASVSISALPALPTGSNTIGNVGVTGSVEIVNDVGNAIPISASALPLPAGAATNTVLTDGTQKTQVTSLPSLPTGANTIGNVGVTGALPAGSNSIGTVVLGAGTAAVGTIGVSALPAIPAGTNSIGTVILGAGSAAIGTVGVTGNVEITNDAGNAIPISATTLPLPSGAASEATLLLIKKAYLNGSVQTTSITSTGGAAYTMLFSDSGSSTAGSLIIQITLNSTVPVGASLSFRGSVDGFTNVLLPFINLVTGASGTSISGTGAAQTFLIGISAVGLSIVTASTSVTGWAGTGQMVWVTTEKTLSAASSGSATSVSVTNFPATQPVSGSVSVNGNVEITNDVGNAIPVSGIIQQQVNAGSGYRGGLGSGSLVGLGMFITYAYGWEISVENNDTGYGLEPIYIKVFTNRTSGSGLIGSATPDYIITVCDGVTLRSSGVFPLPLQWGNGITTFPFFFATRNKADNDVTPVTSSITFTLYHRSTNY
jgi:hypothetical protein